jgi:tetratricopeptide (TPR) repeat protein
MNRNQEAIAEYRQSLQLKPDFTKAWLHLALAHAALKQPEEAIAAAEKAISVARWQNQSAQAQEIEDRLAKYRAEQRHALGTSSETSDSATKP